jgi:pimeloyl-ACP methyl ester carboxylesterase
MSKDPPSHAAGQAPPSMQPVTFDGCFGWLHTSSALAGSDVAIVLCSGLRRDVSNAYRPFRILADQIAAAGYPVLRFDYTGTGNSCDAEAGEYWSVWQQNILAGADYVRTMAGAQRVVLIGLRIGAALATLATACREDITGLILLDPVVRGKSHMTQFSIEARLRNKGLADPHDGLQLDELSLSSETVRQISQFDLRDVVPPPACSVAIFSYDQLPSVVACEKLWSDKGTSVTSKGFTGLGSLLRPAHLADTPLPEFSPILSWLRETLPIGRLNQATTMTRRQPMPRPALLRPAGCVETPLCFGDDRQLFGMLCRPDNGAVSDLAVVIGNPGGDPHHGYARFSVEFARRLAAQGIASLRIDFAGLGDSIGPSDGDGDGEGATTIFETDRSPDFTAAFDALEPMGFRRFAVHGLCSGAYHALHAGLDDRRVTALLLINLPWFSLRHERSSPDSFARRSMAELSRRQVKRFLLYAPGDAGIRPLEQHFGQEGSDLSSSDDVEVSILPGLDHDLTGHAMRRDAADLMIAFLLQVLSLHGDDRADGDLSEGSDLSSDGFATITVQSDAAAA